jgi:putative ABC transport system permease protein
MTSLLQDIRYALRQLGKKPGFTAVAVITLALGIGANTAMFSVIRAVLLRPLAMQDPSRVIYLQEQWRDILPGLSVGNFDDVKQQSTSFASLCASDNASFNLATRETPERVEGEIATANYFATFGIQPLAGRVFTADEDKPGHSQVVVISERLWRARFHADPVMIGQALRINDSSTP